MTDVFVLTIDNDTEGYSPPFQAFSTEEEARALVSVINAATSTSGVRIFRVPVWPAECQSRYYDVKPIE